VRFIDAVTGELARVEDAFTHQRAIGTGQGAHGDLRKVPVVRTGTVYEAVDMFRPAVIRTRSTQGTNAPFEQLFEGAGTTALDADNLWADPHVVEAHVNAGLAYDYFHQEMNWQGLDGSNATIDQVVTDAATIEDNAFFAPPASAASSVGLLAFGVSTAGYPMATLDIVGHEAMHGVTYFSLRQRTGAGLRSASVPDGLGPTEVFFGDQGLPCNGSGLRFADGTFAPFVCVDGRYALASNHGGAINEGFSDVFGTAIEWKFQPPGNAPLRADYTVGDDAMSNVPPPKS
jgi:Zn-dependent metalloprotease